MHLDVVNVEDPYFELIQTGHISNSRPRFGLVYANSKVSLGKKCISIRNRDELLKNLASANKKSAGDHHLDICAKSGKNRPKIKSKLGKQKLGPENFGILKNFEKMEKMGRNKTFS